MRARGGDGGYDEDQDEDPGPWEHDRETPTDAPRSQPRGYPHTAPPQQAPSQPWDRAPAESPAEGQTQQWGRPPSGPPQSEQWSRTPTTPPQPEQWDRTPPAPPQSEQWSRTPPAPPLSQPPPQEWSYAPPPPARPPGTGRRTVILTGVSTLLLGLVIGYAAGHSSATKAAANSPGPIVTVTTSPPAAPNTGTSTGTGTGIPSHATTAAPAKIGAAIVISGNDSGEKMTVTLVKVVDPAKSTDQFLQPDAGKHYVAVQVRLTNSGSAAYSDSPDNGARLIDGQGQQYDPELVGETAVGKSFGGDVKLSPGASALGVILYQLPDGTKPATFQFTLDSGFGKQTGQWQLH